jgi:hypothetical protein
MTDTNQPDSFLIDISYCRAAWGILLGDNQALGYRFPPTNIEQFRIAIHQLKMRRNNKQSYSELKNNCDNNLITEDKLSWINKKDQRACYFVYQKLTQTTLNVSRLNLKWQAAPPNSYDKYIWMEKDATSLADKITTINLTIDTMQLSKETKENYIKQLKKMYSITLATDDFEWAIPNEALHKWLYSYMKAKLSGKNIYFTTDSLIENPLYSAIELYDDWQPMDELEKELFLEKLKKAYRQKSYRQKIKEKENTYTYSMPLNIEDKMTEISRKLGVTRNKILTDLINEKHSSLCLGDRKQTKNII